MTSIWKRLAGVFAHQGVDLSPQAPAYTWSTGAALAPILPPSMPGSSVTVQDALACPPVSRAVGLYSAAMLRHQWAGPAETLEWLRRDPPPTVPGVHGSIPAKLRDVLTLQDLLLHNRALWAVSRTGEEIHDAVYWPQHRWSVDEAGLILMDNEPAHPAEYIYFQGGKMLPFLESAKESLIQYRDMARTITDRGANPIPIVNLQLQEDYDHPEPGDPDYDAETDPALAAAKSWGAARTAKGGAVGITPRNIKAEFPMPNDDAAVMIQARNALRLDIANQMNLNAELLDGDNGSSDTYSNSLQDRGDFADLSLPLFLDPITARLSMPDVSPAGPVTLEWPAAAPAQDPKGNLGTATETQRNAA